MIPTLSDYLYIVNRDRAYLQDKLDKRKAFWLMFVIVAVISFGVTTWILR